MGSPPTYDFWLFDLDGTLVGIDDDYPRAVFERVGERLGHTFADRQVRTLWYGLTGSRNEQLRAWGIDPDRFWPVYHDVEDPSERARAAYRYPDADALLDALDAAVGVVTHSQPQLAEPTLDRLDLWDAIDTLVCCDEDLGWKPDPAPVERAMADLGVDGHGHAGVMVGDGPGDVGAARNAGLDAIRVERVDPAERPRGVPADRRVERLDSLV